MSTPSKYSNSKKASYMQATKKTASKYGSKDPFAKKLFNPFVSKKTNDTTTNEKK